MDEKSRAFAFVEALEKLWKISNENYAQLSMLQIFFYIEIKAFCLWYAWVGQKLNDDNLIYDTDDGYLVLFYIWLYLAAELGYDIKLSICKQYESGIQSLFYFWHL